LGCLDFTEAVELFIIMPSKVPRMSEQVTAGRRKHIASVLSEI